MQFLGKIKLISTFLVEKVKLTHHPQIAGSRSIVRKEINNLLRILDSFFLSVNPEVDIWDLSLLLNCFRTCPDCHVCSTLSFVVMLIHALIIS